MEWYSVQNAVSTGKSRRLFWMRMASHVQDTDFLEVEAAELCSLLFGTVLPLYSDLTDQKAAERVIVAALTKETFLKVFVSGLVRIDAARLSRQECFVLQRWSSLALQALRLPAGLKAVQKLLERQVTYLDSLIWVRVPWTPIGKAVRATLVKDKAFSKAYTDLANTTGSPGLVRALLEGFRLPPSIVTEHSSDVLKIFLDKVLASRAAVPKSILECYRPLFRCLSSEQAEGVLLPALVRAVKRLPEVMLPVMESVLEMLELRLTTYATVIISELLPQLRHAKEGVRDGSAACIQRLAARVSDVDVLAKMSDALEAVLSGKAEGKLRNASERLGVTKGLTALSSSPCRGQGMADVAASVAAALAKLYGEEGNEPIKLEIARCMGAWCAAADAMSAEAQRQFERGLSEKDSLLQAHLRAIVQVFRRSDSARASAGPLLSRLTKVAAEGSAKVAQRAEGIQAALAVALAASASAKVDSTIPASFWESLAAPKAPLLSLATLARLSTQDAASQLLLAESLLLQNALHLGAMATKQCTQLIATAALHHAGMVRQAACSIAARCVREALPLAGQLIAAFQELLRLAPDVPVFNAAMIPEDHGALSQAAASNSLPAEEEGVSPIALSHRLQAALHGMAPPPHNGNSPLEPKHAARFLLAGHHPRITLARARSVSVWQSVHQKLGSTAASLASTAAVSTLTAEEGASSTSSEEREAAKLSLAIAMAENAPGVSQHLMPRLKSMLDLDEHNSLSPTQIKIFTTPHGEMAVKVDIHSVGQQNDHPGLTSKGSQPVGRSAAQVPARMPAPSTKAIYTNGTASKAAPSRGKPGVPKASQKKDPAEFQRERQLAEEEEVRLEVFAIRDRLACGLHALAGSALGSHSFTLEHLQDFLDLVLPLLGSPLVGETAAFDAVHALAQCLPGALGKHALAISRALRLIKQDEQGEADEGGLVHKEAFIESVASVSEATADGQPLPTPAYVMVFPIIRAVLSWPIPSPLHEPALSALALHVSPSVSLPRTSMLALLYQVLETMPAYREKVQPLLESLCRGVTDQEVPAALQGLLAASARTRSAALSALPLLPCLSEGRLSGDSKQAALLWLACHDKDELNSEAAQRLVKAANVDFPQDFVRPLADQLPHDSADIRQAVALALARGIKMHPEMGDIALMVIQECFRHGTRTARSGSALALKACADELTGKQVTDTLDFLLGHGLADHDDEVRSQMISAGMTLVAKHGAEHTANMLAVFEGYLEAKDVADEASYDRVREGVVILLGTLAQHLDTEGPKIRDILSTLIDVLRTPSSDVQHAVSDCLEPLMAILASDEDFVKGLISRVENMLLKGASYADRRGAAFGLAGIIKGLGVSALNQYGTLDTLRRALDDQGNADAREGALFAFESMCERLGRLFEPYIVQLMGKLLERFGDPCASVRHATNGVARAVMANLSSQGVKLVMPSLLEGVDSRAWRSKQGSVQMLGAMAHCAPRQLGTALPSVVPRLSEVLSDPHPKVQSAARHALKEVGSVIRNAEVQALAPVLLAAIAEPNTKAKAALETLLTTTFVNTVDAASLALIVPVVHRGLRDRSGDAKKKAARIVGDMCELINEPKDMAPYVPLLMPELQNALVDPLPEVRATAAHALGSLLRGMGEQHFQGLMPWLLATLNSEKSSVERSGAAQGLAEVLAVLGRSHVDALLPELLAACSSPMPFVREGNLTLFRFLPQAIPDMFQDHLGEVLPAILDGLADESEGVRDAALQAGRTAVELFAQSSLPLLLPAVENGIIHDNWRIRQSSVELLGDLLFKVAGTSGKIQMDGESDEEGLSSEAHGAAIIEALGWERRNEVVASLYMARSDVAYTVRSAALHVWKTIVSNTPRTLAEILPALMTSIIESLASSGEERQQMAGRCLGELVRKMGERVLTHIIPILQKGMSSEDAATRQGVCYGLKELLDNITRQQLAENLGQLLPTVQSALVDPDPGVRQAAASAFNILFKSGGGSAVESVIPTLLSGLEGDNEQAAQALEGLRVILGVRPQTLGSMVPRLLRPPLQSTNLQALGALAEVAGASIHAHLGAIFPPVLALASQRGKGDAASLAAQEVTRKVTAAVAEDGSYLLVAQLEKGLEDPSKRLAAAETIHYYCSNPKHDFQEHVPGLLTALVGLMMEEDKDTLMACWTALGAVINSIPKELQPSYVRTMSEAVQTARDKERRKRKPGPLLLAGFCLPKALQPVLPIYLQGMLQGSSGELREIAAEGLGELVEVTSQEALRPFTVQITGPLIRIIGDRFAWQVKAAILHTLGLLIGKAGPGLKPFVPQLQTTFLKCLSDQARQVRQSAARNLGELTKMSMRVDQLAGDLTTNAKTAKPALRESYLTALCGMLASVGERISPQVLSSTGSTLQELMASTGDDEALRLALSACLGMFVKHSSAEEARQVLLRGPVGPPAHTKGERINYALVLAAIARSAPERLQEVDLVESAVAAVVRFSRDESHAPRHAAARATGHLALAELKGTLEQGTALNPLVPVMVALVGTDQSSDVQRQMLLVLRKIAAENANALVPHYTALIPSIVSLQQQTQGPTKLAGDRTLGRVLQMDQGLEAVHEYLSSAAAGPTGKSYLTEACLRRLSRLPLSDDDDDKFE